MKKKNISKLNSCLIITTVISLITLIIMTVLYINSENKESETKLETYYQNKCYSYEIQNKNLSKGQIVFIGDSITDGYHLDDYYVDLDFATYNRGISGDITTGLKARLKVSVFDITPSKVVIMIGVNDILRGGNVDDITNRYDSILASIYEELPEVEIYILSVLPQNEEVVKKVKVEVTQTMSKTKELNENLESLAIKYDTTYIDLFTHFLDETGYLNSDYTYDGLHLNSEGYTLWTSILKDYLK